MTKKKDKLPVGSVHNNIKIIEDLNVDKARHHYYRCRCMNCHKEFNALQKTILDGKAKCPTCSKPNYVGRIINDYVVMKKTDKRTKDRHVIYICRCTHCSRQKEISSRNLASGTIKSCECSGFNLNKEFLKQIIL